MSKNKVKAEEGEKKEEAVPTEAVDTVKKEEKVLEVPKEPKVAKKISRQNTFVRNAVLIGIVILINLFTTYAVQVAYPEPTYEMFCQSEQIKKSWNNQEECMSNGGQWNEGSGEGVNSTPAFCDTQYSCSREYESAQGLYNRNVFVVFVAVGLFLLAGSLFVGSSTLIASGLSFAGILALIIGSIRYWSDMNDILRLVVLGAALITVLFLAWKKFED